MIKIKNGSNSIVCAVKIYINVIIVGHSEDIRLQEFRNVETATSIVRINILNQTVVVECETFYRAICASKLLVYLLPFNIFRIDNFNFIAKIDEHLHDDIIIRVDIFDNINVVIIRVYIFEDVVAVKNSKIIDNSSKKTR